MRFGGCPCPLARSRPPGLKPPADPSDELIPELYVVPPRDRPLLFPGIVKPSRAPSAHGSLMTPPARPASFLLFLALLVAAPAPAQSPAGDEQPSRVARADAPVVARQFRFRDLPPVAPGGENLPLQRRPNRKWVEYEEQLKALKANPPILPVESFSQFTLDTTPSQGKGSLSPLAPT